MELILDRKLSEKRIFLQLTLYKSQVQEEKIYFLIQMKWVAYIIRKEINGLRKMMQLNRCNLFARTKDNKEFISKNCQNKVNSFKIAVFI